VFERLEHRRLMSATIDDAERTVEVLGTEGADVIFVTSQGNELIVSIRGGRHVFDASKVDLVRISSGGGNDRISGLRADVRLEINGEAGNDLIIGGTLNDTLAGGAGRDNLYGRDGDDTLNGDDGNDGLVGGAGDDTLADTAGDDRMIGGDGDDHFEDRDGRGLAFGGAGADTAVAYAERYRTTGVESVTFAPGAVDPAADPAIHLYAGRAANGAVTVFVEATHTQGGFDRLFGPVRRRGSIYEVEVAGVDVFGDPSAPRPDVIEVETQPYELGRLAPGVYTFNVVSPRGEVRGTLQVAVTTTGLTPETPTQPGPNGTGTVLPPKRGTGTVTGPGGGLSTTPRRFDPLEELARQSVNRPRPTTGTRGGPQVGVSPVVVPGMR
jgi:Ca2+-binding RTX toxin-like protein